LSKQRVALVKSEAVIRLRQKSSLLKVGDSIKLCLELSDNGHQVAISCEFLATMEQIMVPGAKKGAGAVALSRSLRNARSKLDKQRLAFVVVWDDFSLERRWCGPEQISGSFYV
jgi:hypothetical protein